MQRVDRTRLAVRCRTPAHLRGARTCYDHLAGRLGVALHERMIALRWLVRVATPDRRAYALTPAGEKALAQLGVDVAAARSARRRFAYGCTDWSERRPHLAGALGAALLDTALNRRWVRREADTRALQVTPAGRRALRTHFGLET